MAAAGLVLLIALRPASATPSLPSIAAFEEYANSVESRLEAQHRSAERFLQPVGPDGLERIDTSRFHSPGAALHHWRGTAFAAGATAASFEAVLKDIPSYPRVFAPEVLEAKASPEGADRIQTWMRVRQRHVITVTLDTSYDVEFGRLDSMHGFSTSRSTRIQEVGEDHGFLWRQNSYWSYAEQDGGLHLQIETVSLTRSIPRGLGWVIGPYVESVPRESIEFTLQSVVRALRHS